MRPGVVCGIDWSRQCRPALRFADALAARSGLPLTVLHVTSPAPERVQRERGERLHEIVRDVLGRADVPLTIDVGDPSEQLAAASRRAAVVVIGTRGRGAIRQKLGGSVSAPLTRRSACPVVVVPPKACREAGASLGATTVLCAARGARDLACAATAACWATDLELGMTVVHAAAPPAMPAGVALAAMPPVTPFTPAERKAQARESLEPLLAEVSPIAPEDLDAGAVLGSPGRTLDEQARREDAALIVTGPHRHGPLHELLFDSPLRHLLRRGTTPVMICPRASAALLAEDAVAHAAPVH